MDDNITKMKIMPVKPVAITMPPFPVPETIVPPAGKSRLKSKTFWGVALGTLGLFLEQAEPFIDQIPVGKTGSILIKVGIMVAIWGVRTAKTHIN